MAKREKDSLVGRSIPGMDTILASMDKEFGKNLVYLASSKKLMDFPVSSTGSLGLDNILGGGLASGRIHEIYGPPSSGKTTLCLHAIREAQHAALDPNHHFYGRIPVFIDAEYAIDFNWVEKIGVDRSKLLFSQPDDGAQALDIVKRLASTGSASLIVVDSVASLVVPEDIEDDNSDDLSKKVSRLPRLMSTSLKPLVSITHKTGTTILFTNQIRMKVGTLFGSPETTPGGEALRFYATQRMSIRRSGAGGKDPDGVQRSTLSTVKVEKNKIAMPLQSHTFEITFDKGIDTEKEAFTLACDTGIITGGASGVYVMEGQTLPRGKEAIVAEIRNNPKLYDALVQKIEAFYKEG